MINPSRVTFAFYAALTVYKFLLDIIYINFMSVVVAYYGFLYEPTLTRTICSWSLYILCLTLIKSDFKKPSDFFLFIFWISIVAPMFVLMEFSDKSVIFFGYSVVCFLVLSFTVRLPDVKLPKIKNGNKLVMTISLVTVILMFSMFFVKGGFGKINFDLTLVYELREETATVYFGGIWGYITTWAAKIFIPFLLSVALFKKKYLVVALIICIQILVYGITGHRSMAILSLIAIVIFLARNKRHKNFYIISVFMVCLCLVYVLHIYFEDLNISSTIFRRAIFLPSYLNYSYYEFFSVNEYVYYSNTIFSKMIDYPYGDVKLTHVVAGELLGTPFTGANTGFLGSSFAHGGPIGMLIISIFVGIVLKLFNSTCKSSNDTCFYLSFGSIPVLAMLTSAAFFTSLLTHGVLLLLLLTWLYQFNAQPNRNTPRM